MTTIWVLAEPTTKSVTTTSLELISEARRLGGDVTVVTWGESDVAAEVGRYGATTLWHLGSFAGQLPAAPVAAALAGLLETHAVDVLLIPASYDGRDVAGRLSARLDRPVLTNVTGLHLDEGLTTEHPLFGGTMSARARVTSPGVALVVVRAKSFVSDDVGGPPAVTHEAPAVASAVGEATITRSEIAERSGPALEDAAIVVSGGRGLGQPSAYGLIEELAAVLKAAPGASRAIVDAGWVPYAYQVGQTGKTVKPNLYIACGISGATQHLVGMKGAAHIVAINTDKDAPIFSVADFGVVGDASTILPQLIAALRARLS